MLIPECLIFQTLELNEDATEKEIKARYRELAKQYHPDREKDPAKKEAAAEKFVEIQKAYETLSQAKTRRAQASKKSRKGTEYDQDHWKFKS